MDKVGIPKTNSELKKPTLYITTRQSGIQMHIHVTKR